MIMNNKHPELDKLLENGGISLTDEEYLTLLLSYTKTRSPNKTARELLTIYGSFSGVIDAAPHLLTAGGISAECAVLFRLISRFAAICAADNVISRLTDTKSAVNYFSTLYIGSSAETFAIAAVDKNMRIIAADKLSTGSTRQVSSAIRDIMQFIVRHKAERIFISHNHPMGIAQASDADISATQKIIAALSSLGTAVVDHIIIGKDGGFSMREADSCPALSNIVCDSYTISKDDAI